MTKLAKYLKPYIALLVVAIVFLFAQALCDLNLPNFMSDIVNVGIQQSGIDSAVPDAISQDGMKLVQLFMNEQDKALVENSYTLSSNPKISSEEHNNALAKFPAMEDTEIYLLTEKGAEPLQKLDTVFGRSLYAFTGILKEMTPANADQDSEEKAVPTDFDMKTIYEALPALSHLPPETLEKAISDAQKTPDMMISQVGAVFVKAFYTELGTDTGAIQSNYILTIGAIMLLISLIGVAAAVLVGFCASRIAAGVAQKLRQDVFSKVESFSNNEFDQFSTSSLITRTTNDITQIQTLIVMAVRMIFYAPILAIGGIVMAVNTGPSISWIIGVAVILLIALILAIYFLVMPKFKIVQKLIDRLNLVSRENLTGTMVVRAFGNQNFEKDRFDIANQDLTRTNLFINRAMTFMMPVMMLFMNLITLLIVWAGANEIGQSAMQVGDMMAFMQYAMQIIMSFLMLSIMFIMVPRAAVSAVRIAEVLAVQPSIVDAKALKPFNKDQTGVVEFKNVSFHYEGAEEDVLRNISFTALPGQTTAFIGSTGSGKSTLINLIPRFYDVTDGQILVNGTDVREVSQYDLRETIGYVPQKGILLSGTIASNLRYGKENATDAEVAEAAEIAQATEFITSKEDQFESSISQGGSNVSGGQKQRLSIARALIKKSPIYIFDDSFSALDFKTDSALRKALKASLTSSTILIVAQRVSTVMNAEQIIVLNEGEIVGKGTHKELLASCPTYFEIASSQLSKEELQ